MVLAYYLDVVLPIPLERAFTYSISAEEAKLIKPGMRVAVPFGKTKIHTALSLRVHNNAREVMRSALPSAFLLESETLIVLNKETDLEESTLKDDEFLVYEALGYQPQLTISNISEIVGRKNVMPLINRLMGKGVVLQKEELYEQYKPKLVRFVKLADAYNSEAAIEILLDTLSRAPKQKEALMHLFQLQAATKKPVKVKELETASGKTAVYIKLIEKALKQRKQVLYLLPEIALTSQLISKLKQHFACQVAVYHSRYSLNERVEVWNNVLAQKEKAQIIVGARSSLFLPFSNLGLVVIDEEHESSFKQFDPAPRYHARDAAIFLANLHNSNCILGSATPSVESMFNAKSGKFGLAVMPFRYSEAPMPVISMINLKEAVRKKQMKGHFSNELITNIQETVLKGQQVILFQNRRGYAPIVECSTCGHSPQCPNCDVSLTYHSFQNQLRCHYCGHNRQSEAGCEACGSFTLDKLGLGTEQVQKELAEYLPEIRIGRMDLDTTRGKYAHEKLITAFEQQEYDVLIGTQMVTKGLDFANVGLVGIMNADTLLNFPDYRSHERSFQLLVQVAGRAGRLEKLGKVLVQTYNPYHPILGQVSEYDYEQMYDNQILDRSHFGYPPYMKIIKLTLKDRDYNKLNEASKWFYDSLKTIFPTQKILGPEHPPVARIRRYYLKNILFKLEVNQSPSKIKNGIKRIEKSFNAISHYKSVRIVYNVDHI